MRRFELSDIPEIREWTEKWDCATPESFPELGYIEPGVAAGFLVKSECGICFLEGFVTNPDAPKEPKSDAKIEIAQKLIIEAKGLGFRKILVITNNAVMKYIAKTQFNFRETPAAFLTMEL